jgi:hypothetical protein
MVYPYLMGEKVWEKESILPESGQMEHFGQMILSFMFEYFRILQNCQLWFFCGNSPK